MESHRTGHPAADSTSDLPHREASTAEIEEEAGLTPRPLSWRRPFSAIAVILILGYQRLLSPLLGANCRFHPTCSQYTRLAIEKYGVIRGIWKGIRRILRCHPWNPGGFDPP